METNPIGGSSSSSENAAGNDALRGLDLDEFLKLMITELQNQDPLNPLENSEILQQISQIREIESTTRLTSTLESILLGQQLSSAGSLIHQNVRGLSDAGKAISGTVDRVSIVEGKAKLHIGSDVVSLNNVSEILGDEADTEVDVATP